jgi:hypothetical protein
MTKMILLVLLGCVLLSGGLYAQTVSPVNADPFPLPAPVSNAQMAVVASAAAQKMRYYAIWLCDIVGPHADSVFLAIVWYVIVAKIALIGFRIMIGGNLVEELVHFLLGAIILLLLFFQLPQGAVARLKDSFEEAGRALGVTIVEGTKTVRSTINDSTEALPEQISASSVTSVEPLSYWIDWLGDPSDPKKSVTFKYDSNYIAQTIFRTDLTEAGVAKQAAAYMSVLIGQNAAAAVTGGAMSSVQTIANLITAMNPFLVFNYALLTAQIQVAGYAAITFSQLAILFGAHIGFALLYAFGMALMPLIFFKSYFSLWAHYLTTLIGFALVPGFYYIFSAVGYGFATVTFEILFLNQTAPLGAYLWQAFHAAFSEAAATFKGVFGLGTLAANAAFGLLELTIGMNIMRLIGAGLVTSFLAMGTAFAALAPAVASKWNSGFIDMGILDTSNNTIRSIESTMGSLIGQGMGMGARNIAGFTRGLAGGLGSMMGR